MFLPNLHAAEAMYIELYSLRLVVEHRLYIQFVERSA